VLCCVVLGCVVLYCIGLCCVVLCCVVLGCVGLYCIVLCWAVMDREMGFPDTTYLGSFGVCISVRNLQFSICDL
jgi:hypothetical protein